MITPALPDVRPAPQAGCFVSRLYASCESQVVCDSLAFRTGALAPSRRRRTSCPPSCRNAKRLRHVARAIAHAVRRRGRGRKPEVLSHPCALVTAREKRLAGLGISAASQHRGPRVEALLAGRYTVIAVWL